MEIFGILITFQVKHYLADYVLQNRYMLGKFKAGTDWIAPLALHCAVHACFTLMIALLWKLPRNDAMHLACLDFGLHFIMDRIKAAPNLFGRFKPNEATYWYVLGFDQMFHHLSHYLIIYLILF